MSRPEKPKRAFEVTLKIGADSWKDVIDQVDHLGFVLEQSGPKCSSVSGGPSSNHSVEVVHNPEQTHDKYFSQLDDFLEDQREREEREKHERDPR